MKLLCCIISLILYIYLDQYSSVLQTSMQFPSSTGPDYATYPQCLKHRMTTDIGKPIQKSAVCECCNKPYEKQSMKINFNLKQLSYLGAGLPLYFEFLKICICFILLLTLVTGILLLSYNLLGTSQSGLVKASLINVINNRSTLMVQSIVTNIGIILSFVLIEYTKKYFSDRQIEYQQKLQLTDYSVFFKLPNNTFNEIDIINAIKKWWEIEKCKYIEDTQNLLYKNNQIFSVQKIILSYKISVLYEGVRQYYEIIHQKQKDLQLQHLGKLYLQKHMPLNPKCIVVFSLPEQQKYILRKMKKTLIRFLFPCFFNDIQINGEDIRVTQASPADQILWKNHQTTDQVKIIFRNLTKLLSLSIAIVMLLCIYGISRNITPITPYLIIFLWLIFDSLTKLIFSKTIFLQYRPIKIDQSVAQINRFLLYCISSKTLGLWIMYTNMNCTQFLVQLLTLMLLFDAVLPHIFKFCTLKTLNNIYYTIKVRSTEMMSGSWLNQKFEKPQFILKDKYSLVISQIYMACLLGRFIPLVFFLIFISLLVHYWTQKLALVKYYAEPIQQSKQLAFASIRYLEYCPLLYAISNCICDIVTFNSNIIALDVVVILLNFSLLFIFSFQNIIQKMIPKSSKMYLNHQFSQLPKNIRHNYQNYNPAYNNPEIQRLVDRFSSLNAEDELLTQKLSRKIKQTTLQQHPLKTLNNPSTIDVSFQDTPYTPRISRDQSPQTPRVPRLPFGNKSFPLNLQAQIELMQFSKIFEDFNQAQKQRLINKIKLNVDRINK